MKLLAIEIDELPKDFRYGECVFEEDYGNCHLTGGYPPPCKTACPLLNPEKHGIEVKIRNNDSAKQITDKS